MASRLPLVLVSGELAELPAADKVAASNIGNTPAGNIAATDVQAAINELDAEKAALAGSSGQNFAVNALTATASVSAVGVGLNTGPASAGTGPTWVVARNSGGDFFFGKEGSTPGGYFTATAAYDNVLYGSGAIKINVDGTVSGAFTSSGLAVPGAVSATGTLSGGASLILGASGVGGQIDYYGDVSGYFEYVNRMGSNKGYRWYTGAGGSAIGMELSAGGNLIAAGAVGATTRFDLPSYTVGTLPAVGAAGGSIYVSNETGGATLAFSDGTNWRRVTDRAVVS